MSKADTFNGGSLPAYRAREPTTSGVGQLGSLTHGGRLPPHSTFIAAARKASPALYPPSSTVCVQPLRTHMPRHDVSPVLAFSETCGQSR